MFSENFALKCSYIYRKNLSYTNNNKKNANRVLVNNFLYMHDLILYLKYICALFYTHNLKFEIKNKIHMLSSLNRRG